MNQAMWGAHQWWASAGGFVVGWLIGSILRPFRFVTIWLDRRRRRAIQESFVGLETKERLQSRQQRRQWGREFGAAAAANAARAAAAGPTVKRPGRIKRVIDRLQGVHAHRAGRQ